MAKGLGKLPKADKIAEKLMRGVYKEMSSAELKYIEWESPSKREPDNFIRVSSDMDGYKVEVTVRITKT